MPTATDLPVEPDTPSCRPAAASDTEAILDAEAADAARLKQSILKTAFEGRLVRRLRRRARKRSVGPAQVWRCGIGQADQAQARRQDLIAIAGLRGGMIS